MLSVTLDQVAAVWRKDTVSTGSYEDIEVYHGIRCSIVPISSLDIAVSYARESTHVVWVPYWLALRKEDQVRTGRQLPDPQGDLQPWIYTINGRRFFHMGVPQIAYYARELD